MTYELSVFISYPRADGKYNSIRLRNDLTSQGIASWQNERIDSDIDFTDEIEKAIGSASHVAVVITPNMDSYMRLEIGFALALDKHIIPLVFAGGHCPISIINYTSIDFADWDTGFATLLERLRNFGSGKVVPITLQERELGYIQQLGQRYDYWGDLYTEIATIARLDISKVKTKWTAKRYLEMRYKAYEHTNDAEANKRDMVTWEALVELYDSILIYKHVLLIGDLGAGKTTTLEGLAYKLASDAVDEKGNLNPAKILPIIVPLGAYTGDDFAAFTQSFFGGLTLQDYLPMGVLLLLDGLNEMPKAHLFKLEEWLKQNPEVRVVVSCRNRDYFEGKLPFQRIDIEPLDVKRIRQFIGNYLEADVHESLFRTLAGLEARRALDSDISPEKTYNELFDVQDEESGNLYSDHNILEKLSPSFKEGTKLPQLLEMLTNPFLLSAVIEIYAAKGKIPRSKGDLLGRFVDLHLEKGRKIAESADRQWIDEIIQKQALAALAYRMRSLGAGNVSQDFVLETFANTVKNHEPTLLLYLAISTGIVKHSRGIHFNHQLLQEYFIAYEMSQDLQHGLPATKYFPSEAWWTPTDFEDSALLLSGILGDVSSVVEWLTPVQPDLAYTVVTESSAECSESALASLYQPRLGERRSPYALAEWGRKISFEDKRRGIGWIDVSQLEVERLLVKALPDIAWGKDIPIGKYKIGGDEGAARGLPAQEIQLNYSYCLAKYPITMAQFQTFLNDKQTGFELKEWWDGFPNEYKKQKMSKQHNPYLNHPRDTISWYQAVAFCRWVTAKYHVAEWLDETWEIRLPTEEEWEIAARFPDGREYPWGNGYRIGHANCNEQAEGVGPYYLGKTTALGLYELGKQAELDLYDMAGTIWEWCLSKWTGSAPIIDASGDWRVLRGGACYDDTHFARAASRNPNMPNFRHYNVGFRVCAAPIVNLPRQPHD